MITLELNHLTIFRQKKMICQNLNITMRAPERWAILGCNGSGKTSLLLSLANLLKYQGDITFNHRNSSDYSQQEFAQLFAILFQDQPREFPLTVGEFIAQSRFPYHTLWQALTRQDQHILETIIHELDLEKLIHRNIQTLSGGEFQRVAIAATLAQTTPIIALDEICNHLDFHHQHFILTYLLQRCADKLIIMSLHDLYQVSRYCTHALLLYDDYSYEAGALENVLTAENLSRLYHHPLKKLNVDNQTFWISE
ncbi:MAG: ABC transporter ATP-binding protein [Legionellales bacterium]|nr:ABC transporter ATP-binding protein [Legionellales bacterium]